MPALGAAVLTLSAGYAWMPAGREPEVPQVPGMMNGDASEKTSEYVRGASYEVGKPLKPRVDSRKDE